MFLRRFWYNFKWQQQKKYGTASYQWIECPEHKGYKMTWLECIWPGVPKKEEEVPTKRFCYVTNLTPGGAGSSLDMVVVGIAQFCRQRWKIKNEGFNWQKNQGYSLHHKFSRRSLDTLHVYYMLLQIAHLINQVVIHSQEVAALLSAKSKV